MSPTLVQEAALAVLLMLLFSALLGCAFLVLFLSLHPHSCSFGLAHFSSSSEFVGDARSCPDVESQPVYINRGPTCQVKKLALPHRQLLVPSLTFLANHTLLIRNLAPFCAISSELADDDAGPAE